MKKKFAIHYGREKLALDIHKECVNYNLSPADVPVVESVEQEIARALAHPVGAPQLNELAKSGSKVVILGDDATRLTPTRIITPQVIDQLNQGGIPDKDISLVIATGTHRAMTDAELDDKYGQSVLKRVKVFSHDCLDRNNLISYGRTRRGTNIWVNRMVMEADIRIGIGNIVPHHPTGWSGGAKILLPGVAGRETAGQMHLLGATEQLLGEIETPCREEMEDFALATGLDFIVNTVLNRDGEVIRIVAGHFINAHREGVQWAKKVFGVPFKEKSDITLSSTFPVDNDLFQADKGLFSALISTNEGGEIVLISPCYEKLSATHPEAAELAGLSDEELHTLAKMNSDSHDPLSIAEVLYFNTPKKGFNVTLVSEGIKKEFADKLGYNHLHPSQLQTYLDIKFIENNELSIGIINNSAETLPIYQNQLMEVL